MLARRGSASNRCSSQRVSGVGVHPYIQRSDCDTEVYKKLVKNGEYFHKQQYFIPILKYTKGTRKDGPAPNPCFRPMATEDLEIRGTDILYWEHVGNPIIIFGQPYSGKTSFFLKLCVNSPSLYSPNHWVHFVEMRHLAELVRSLPKRPKSFLHLLALHLKTTEKELKCIFQPGPKFKKNDHIGELFLDGFDEIPAIERDYFWRLIPQLKYRKGESAIRIWISCRTYVKPTLAKVFPELGYFDIMKYSPARLADLLYTYWQLEYFKNAGQETAHKILIFTKQLHTELKLIIPTFDHGIGCLPMCIALIAALFSPHLSQFLGTKNPDSKIKQPKIYFTDLVNMIVRKMIECYCLKLTPSDSKYEPELVDKEFPKIVQLYSAYALKTYPSYVYGIEMAMAHPNGPATDAKYKKAVHITEEMHIVGLILKNDSGNLQFHHRTFGDFLLAKYFEFRSLQAPEKCDPDFDRFYLRDMLFEQGEGTGIRILSYYDYFLGKQDQDGIYYSAILHDFLITHYRLRKDEEEEWEKIKDNGTVWHLAVFQRHNNIARRFLNAFKVNEGEELKKFLMMSVPLGVLEGNDLQTIQVSQDLVRNQRVLSSLSILALFGYGTFVAEMIDIFLEVFSNEELEKEFNTQGEWSPIHYAARHTNLWFIKEAYESGFRRSVAIKPGIYNSEGLLPTHLLLTGAWFYYVIKVKDGNLSDYDLLTSTSGGSLPITTPGGSIAKLATSSNVNCTNKNFDGVRKAEGESEESPVNFNAKVKDDFRIVLQDGIMRKDWRGVPGLLQSLHTCIELMVNEGGEDVNAFDRTQASTVTFWAVEQNLIETLQCLIDKKANLNVRNVDGVTPIHVAGIKGLKTMFIFLARQGAKPTVRDCKGQSAMKLWRECGEQTYFSNGGPPLTEKEVEFFVVVQGFDTGVNGNNGINNFISYGPVEGMSGPPVVLEEESSVLEAQIIVEELPTDDDDENDDNEEYGGEGDTSDSEGSLAEGIQLEEDHEQTIQEEDEDAEVRREKTVVAEEAKKELGVAIEENLGQEAYEVIEADEDVVGEGN